MIFYKLLTYLYLPFALIKIFSKKEFSMFEMSRIKERFGFKPLKIQAHKEDCIWIHAVSVGEVNTSINLIEEIQLEYPDRSILISTTTVTGSSRVKKILGDTVNHQYFPFDLDFCVDKFLKFWKPTCMILIDTEVWPNMVSSCSKKKIPVVLLNGRLSESSKKKYLKFPNFFKEIFRLFDLVIAQSENDKNNFIELGVLRKNAFHDFSLKFDAAAKLISGLSFKVDRDALSKKRIITCASTHPGEEEILLESFQKLNDESIHLVIAPRHPHRAEEVGEIIRDFDIKFSYLEQEEETLFNLNNRISVVNKIGHLDSIFSISTIAFIGGTLVPHGGQNFLEAVKYGIPISSGKSTFNFKEISEDLIKKGILKQGETSSEIFSIWEKDLLKSFEESIQVASKEYLLSKKGSVKRSVQKINNLIN